MITVKFHRTENAMDSLSYIPSFALIGEGVGTETPKL